MVNVKIDEDTLLDMLMERVEYWRERYSLSYKLFEQMYQNQVDGGLFDGAELDVMCIVDNDIVNWCSVVEKDEEDYDKLKKVYEEQGLGDCSCEDCNGNFIEAYDEDTGAFLIRW